MKKASFIFFVLVLVNVTITFAQKNCFSIKNYPFVDLKSIKDSASFHAALNLQRTMLIKFYEDMYGCKMPSLNEISIDGDTITNKNLESKVVVINFWFIECAPCIAEIPYLDSIHQHFKSKNVEFIGISSDTKEQILTFLKQKIFPYKMIADGVDISWRFTLSSWPQTYIFDKKGRFRALYHYIGKENVQLEVEQKITELLK